MLVMRYFLEKIDIMTETFVDTGKDITHGHYYQQFLEPRTLSPCRSEY